MITRSIAEILIGAFLMLQGILIYFFKKYKLIGGFQEDLEAGKKSVNYARSVGLIQLVFGTLMAASGAFSFLLPVLASWPVIIAIIVLMVVILMAIPRK